MSQDLIAGCGNYIKSDALYIAKISPHTNTSKLSGKEINALYKAIKYITYSNLITWFREDRMRIPRDIKKNIPCWSELVARIHNNPARPPNGADLQSVT